MSTANLEQRPLGRMGTRLSVIGYGAFKIGRNVGIKYPQPYDLPDEREAARILHAALDLGINYIDTAPAYGVSEARLGALLADRREAFVVSTKVGETFEDGRSAYDFSRAATLRSIDHSRTRLDRERLDLVFVHSDGNDLAIQRETDVVPALAELKRDGVIGAIGFSGKTVDGARAALEWADAIMVEYHRRDPSHRAVIAEASERGVGVVVKKGLASGHLAQEGGARSTAEAIRFVLETPGVTSLIIGGLNVAHLRANVAVAHKRINDGAGNG